VQAEIVRNTCEIIHLLTDSNPIQVIVDAIINRCAIAVASAKQHVTIA
jgi:small subunit ribosomal protein S5e